MNLPSDLPIRRHADGSIDIDHYARKASTERREAFARCSALVTAALRGLTRGTHAAPENA